MNWAICLYKHRALCHKWRQGFCSFSLPNLSSAVLLIWGHSLYTRQVVYKDNEHSGRMNVSEIISSALMNTCPRFSIINEVKSWHAFDSYGRQMSFIEIFLCLSFFFKAAHPLVPPHGRWGGWCVRARPPLLAHHIPGDKVWRPGHTDTWPCPGTVQRHAALWSRRGAQTTLLRWGWWRTIFQKRNRNAVLCVTISVIKLKRETMMRDSLWEMGNNVATLISSLAPGSRDHSGFYGLYGVYPAALLFNGARRALWLKGRDRSAHLRKQ